MKVIISTQELNQLINKIQNVIPLKPTIPILTNFLIEASNDELILTATDMTVSIRCHTESQILEEGATTLPAKKLSQLVKELTTVNVELSTNANEVTTVAAGTSRFKLNGMKKNDFPHLPDLSEAHTFSIPQAILKELLYNTAFAVSKEDNRYVLTGVLMQSSNNLTTFVGTDGKRLALAQTTVESDPPLDCHCIIPLKAVDEILKNLTDEGEATVSLMKDKIVVEAGQTMIMSKLLSGDYPEYQRVIPENSEYFISLHREELTSLLRQISLFLVDQSHSARFIFTEGELKLNANTMEIGEGDVGMPVNYHGPKLEVAFNPGFFLDILRHCKEENVTLGLTDSYNPGIVTDGLEPGKLGVSSPLFVIMPMRLSEE